MVQRRGRIGFMLGFCLLGACGDSGSAGAGGTGGVGAGGTAGQGGQAECSSPADCPAATETCKVATCTDGACAIGNAPEGPAASQIEGDCTEELCADGVGSTEPIDIGTACTQDGGNVCDGMGECVGCITSADCTEPDAPACDPTGVCVALSCTDQTKNGDETDVDCGGSCAPCAAGADCLVPGDCQSLVCQDSACQEATCTDGVGNGSETDEDCGGPDCPQCGAGEGCDSGEDCIGGECSGMNGTCVPNCADGTKNNAETDVDCGGGACAQCSIGQLCEASDANCGVTAYCDAAGTCAPKTPNGTPCAGFNQCTSGACHDGVCCNGDCSGLCQYCDPAGSCQLVPQLTDPDNECNGNGGSDVCNGQAGCGLALGASCVGDAACGSGFCRDGVCCNGHCGQTCNACSNAMTGGLDGICGPVSANTDPNSECAGVRTCNGTGGCSPALANGTACTVAAECQSGVCVDGVCCNNSCAGLCSACDTANVGTCAYFPAGTDPDNECPGACNGANGCQ